MLNTKKQKLASAIQVALFVSAATLVSGTAFAQEESKAKDLDRIEVTGSRIKRTEVEGPSPVTVISRAEIEAAGEISVADYLRNNVYNAFGSTRESSGSATGSQATISLRGLGSAYTLVLLDGRRMTTSGALAGGAANINLIPTAAVERIEVLREGAGAVYGSDAIGGVVNVILRKDYEGLSFNAGYEMPKVGPNGTTASISGGISSERGNLTFVLDHQEREMMYNREIKSLVTGAGLAWGLSAFNSSANFLSPSTGFVGVANCDTFENSVRVNANHCRFDHGATSANESSLTRDALLVNGTFNITDSTSFFFRGLSSRTSSLGVYAAAPVTRDDKDQPYPTISASNPYNPFGVDGTLYYRFTPLGTRDSHRRDTMRDYSFGLRGSNDWLGGFDWEVGLNHGRVAQSSVNYNYGIFSALQEAIDSGNYNPFDPTHPSVATAAKAVGHTVLVESEMISKGIDGNVSFDLFNIGERPVGFVAGFEHREDRLKQVYDAQSAANNVFGSAGAGGGGQRKYSAAYFEALFPLLDSFSLTVAGRYDDYSDVGGKFSPRASFEFRPVDSLLFRGSWGRGFRAPTLKDLHGAPSTTNLNNPPLASAGLPGGDKLACDALTAYRNASGNASYQPYPVDPCDNTEQYQWLITSNPNLKPEESTNWGLGFVWSPTAELSFAVDYYDIKIENIITTLPRAMAFAYGDQGVPGYGVSRSATITAPDGVTLLPGVPQQILLPSVNGAQRTVRGVDLEANWRMDTTAGRFSTKLAWSHMLEFNLTPPFAAEQELIGTMSYPKNRGQLVLAWDKGPVSTALITNYIGKNSDDRTNYKVSQPSWTTFDGQISVVTPWNGKVTLGVRNIANKMPPFRAVHGFPYYDNSLYNIWGRTPYLRYEQNF